MIIDSGCSGSGALDEGVASGILSSVSFNISLLGVSLSSVTVSVSVSVSASISKKIVPSLTVSPLLTFISTIFPATDAGISMAAFSDSKTIIESSLETVSPGWTQISITSTSTASPKSGIFIFSIVI